MDEQFRQSATMTRRTFQAGALAVAASGGICMADSSAISGTWSGVLSVGSSRLRLKLEIGADGTATLFSIDQGSTPLPGHANLNGAAVAIDFPVIKGHFEGTSAGDRIEGTWHQGGDHPLTFERGEDALVPLPPPRPLTRERLAEVRAQCGAPAMAAAAARGTATALSWVDGERLVGSGIAAKLDDVWHLGSITKSMTATLVARLVEAGAVRWDDTVGDLLATAAPDMNEAYRGATLRHLLCHRSGMPKDISPSQFKEFSREIADARDERRKYARDALAMTPEGPMTTTYEYSNNGYIVAGAMLEAKLADSWENLIRAHLFEPLQLTTAGFGAPGRAGAIEQPVGHAEGPNGLRAFPVGGRITDNPAALGPAGRVHMNLKDLLKYLATHRDRTAYLRPQTWDTLHTPPFGGDYAMGWVVRGDGSRWHNGSNTIWYAEVLFNRTSAIVTAAVCNDGNLTKMTPAVGSVLLAAAAAV